MKKIFTLIMALLMVAVLFTGCQTTEGSDYDYVVGKGKLIVGITDFAPMDYKENGEWVGFDADMARAFAESLGVEVEFVVINWKQKEFELNNKSIDVVWNGMTLTDGVKNAMSTSNAYCTNAQVVVVRKDVADQYQTEESIKGLQFVAEGGSAGETLLKDLGYNVLPVTAQSDALKEVAAGTAEAAVIDLLMAGAMIGDGTSYENLTYTVKLNSEEYGVGFRKGSDLTEKLNDFFVKSYNDGSMLEIARRYGTQESIIKQG